MDARALLLTTAFRHRISEPNIEAGFERFSELTGESVSYDAFCDAVAACLRDRLMTGQTPAPWSHRLRHRHHSPS